MTMYSPSSPTSTSSGENETSIAETETTETVLWDRKVDGGFPGMFSFYFTYRFPFRVWWMCVCVCADKCT